MPRTVLMRTRIAVVVALVAGTAVFSVARGDAQSPPKPVRASLAELWMEPPAGRDLFFGVGGRRLGPDPTELFTVVEIKASGYSDGYNVVDRRKRHWSVKLQPEASTEIIASRILWGIGYHQPPAYLLSEWRADGADDPNPQRPARFREKKPEFYGLDEAGTWAYDDNPFAGTRQLKALLVLQAMLGNSDLKPANNVLYTLARPVEGARRWYVVRDLGQTFGRTGVLDAPRGDIEAFEKTPFIRAVNGRHVELEYHGRHEALFTDISVADVEWLCGRLSRLSDRQWRDAFRAGGYASPLANRFIRRMKQKITEGLHVTSAERRRS